MHFQTLQYFNSCLSTSLCIGVHRCTCSGCRMRACSARAFQDDVQGLQCERGAIVPCQSDLATAQHKALMTNRWTGWKLVAQGRRCLKVHIAGPLTVILSCLCIFGLAHMWNGQIPMRSINPLTVSKHREPPRSQR